MRRIERNSLYPAAGGPTRAPWGADPDVRDLADALQSAMPDEYADAGEQEMQDALANVMDVLTPAEAFDFGSALNRIAKGANQVLSDPTFQSVARTALPIAGQAVGSLYGGPIGGAIGGNLGNLAAGALSRGSAPAPAARPTMQQTAALASGPAPPASPVAGGSTAAAQALVLTQQPDVLRSLLATALGQYGRKEVSGLPNAQVLSQLSRLFGEAAADADELMYLDQESGTAEGTTTPSGSPAALYADLLGADNAELAEAAEWEGLY